VPIQQDVMQLEGLKIDPQAYDVTLIRNDMDLMVGLSDASRSNLIKPKTATEAELMQEALQNRVAERRDTHEDLMSEMASSALEIALQDLTKDEVKQLAGEDAEWPEAPQTVENVFRQVVVRVRAGSTGKPNQAKEREQWGQLLPQIAEAVKQVNELRMAGNFEMADAVVQLLRETIRRFDEHLDLDAIIPPVKKDAEGRPVQQAAMVAQMQQQLAQCKEDLAKCQDELNKAKAGEAAKVRQAELEAEQGAREALVKANEQATETQRQHEMKLAQEAAKAEAERTKQSDLEKKDALERARMDKEFELKQKQLEADKAAAIEIAEINANAKAKAAAAPQGAADGGAAKPSSDLGELLQIFRDFVEADRVPEYGADGMPTRVRLVKKQKKSAPQAH
jgi:hypothetical protein